MLIPAPIALKRTELAPLLRMKSLVPRTFSVKKGRSCVSLSAMAVATACAKPAIAAVPVRGDDPATREDGGELRREGFRPKDAHDGHRCILGLVGFICVHERDILSPYEIESLRLISANGLSHIPIQTAGSSCAIFTASASFAAERTRSAFSRTVERHSLSSRPCMCGLSFDFR